MVKPMEMTNLVEIFLFFFLVKVLAMEQKPSLKRQFDGEDMQSKQPKLELDEILAKEPIENLVHEPVENVLNEPVENIVQEQVPAIMVGVVELSTMNLTDLNDDCLENIFKYLSLLDLLNIATSDDRFSGASCWALKRKLRGRMVKIDSTNISITGEQTDYIFDDVYYANHSVLMVMRFFKYFGKLITKLNVDYKLKCGEFYRGFQQEVESGILNYCTKTLRKLSIKNMQRTFDVLNDIRKPFEMLYSLTIHGGYLKNVGQFNKWFPELRSLALLFNYHGKGNCIGVHFPKLEKLNLRELDFNQYYLNCFNLSDIEQAIRMNPQLRDLSVRATDAELEYGFCKFVDKHLPRLEHIELTSDFDELKNEESKVIKNIKKLTTERVPKLTFTQLEELRLFHIENGVEAIEFAEQNEHLIKLIITIDDMSTFRLKSEDITRFIRSVPKLTELTLDWDLITTDGVVQLLKDCKSLRKFRLLFYFRSSLYEQFMDEHIAPEWKITMTFTSHVHQLDFNKIKA